MHYVDKTNFFEGLNSNLISGNCNFLILDDIRQWTILLIFSLYDKYDFFKLMEQKNVVSTLEGLLFDYDE